MSTHAAPPTRRPYVCRGGPDPPFGHVGERAIAIVVIKRVPIDPGHENVVVAVIVVVADCQADIEPGSLEAPFRSRR